MNTEFEKGQIVFQACSNFATVGESGLNGTKFKPAVNIGIVIERKLNSCNDERVFFVDRGGNDFVFGRVYYFAWRADGIFATADEAFEALQSDVICPDVYSDADKKSFDDFRGGKMRIAPDTK